MGALVVAIEGWGIAEFLRRSIWAYPLVNLTHVLAIGFLVTSAVLMDLRVLGLAGRRLEVAIVISHLRPVAITGLTVAVVAGFLLFTVQATHYAANPIYLAKMALLAVAVLNAVLFTSFRAERDPEAGATRAMALLSIVLWLSVALAGRLIAFFD